MANLELKVSFKPAELSAGLLNIQICFYYATKYHTLFISGFSAGPFTFLFVCVVNGYGTELVNVDRLLFV